jgi:tripartite-type tricarboxylate transporter receptor subunit TctC
MRKLAVSMLAVLLPAVMQAALAAFPDKPLKIVSGYAAGGASDLIARFIADAVSPILGQRVVVENRPGLNGVIGAEAVARSTPDGYSVFQCPMSTLSITPQLIGASVPLDPGVELLPLSNMALSSYGLVVAAASPHRSMADVIAAARARPGQITFGSPGPGSAQHLSGELLMRLANLTMQHIAYKGSAPAAVDLMAGRIDFMITNLGDVGRQVQAGQLRLLAQGDPSKFPLFPDLPRIADTVPGFEITGWFGICGPKGMPAEAVARWDEAIRQAMQDPAFVRRLQDAGFTPLYEGPAPFARRLETDRKRWREVIQAGKVGAQ